MSRREETTDSALFDRLAARLKTADDVRRETGYPLVTLSFAQSLDGSIACRDRRKLLISSRETMVLAHALRARHDAILVGVGTVLSDDPRLTVRLVAGKNPRPVVVDSRLRIPLTARLLAGKNPAPWIATTGAADPVRLRRLEGLGSRIISLPAEAGGMVNLSLLLHQLADTGVRSVMVEGGARIIGRFLQQRLVDQLVITLAPCLIGGLKAVPAMDAGPQLPGLSAWKCERWGHDMVLFAEANR